jgi:hypothetical protein
MRTVDNLANSIHIHKIKYEQNKKNIPLVVLQQKVVCLTNCIWLLV